MPLQLPTILPPPTPCTPVSALTVLSAAQATKLPLSLPGTASVLGFAVPSQARQCIRPNRVYHFLNYGLVVRFRLLSTPPLGDAVNLQLRTASALSDGDFHPAVGAHSQAHEGRPPCRPLMISGLRDKEKNGTAQ